MIYASPDLINTNCEPQMDMNDLTPKRLSDISIFRCLLQCKANCGSPTTFLCFIEPLYNMYRLRLYCIVGNDSPCAKTNY